MPQLQHEEFHCDFCPKFLDINDLVPSIPFLYPLLPILLQSTNKARIQGRNNCRGCNKKIFHLLHSPLTSSLHASFIQKFIHNIPITLIILDPKDIINNFYQKTTQFPLFQLSKAYCSSCFIHNIAQGLGRVISIW